MLSEKQRIYLDILSRILPYVRNVETWNVFRRVRFGGALPEAELVHNLPRCMLEPDFGREDIWWLNVQARSYCEGSTERPFHAAVAKAVCDLIVLMPAASREQLEWSGPQPPEAGG